MNTPSAFRDETGTPSRDTPLAPARTILVWDLPVRLFHWSMVLCFAGAWLTAESERWRLLHVSLGYGMAALVAFRLVWGLVGSRHARFASFVRGPATVLAYLRSLTGPRPQHHVGHNPAGGWAILGLLVLGVVVVGAGWAHYDSLGGEWLERLHRRAAKLMLILVFVHVAGVVLSSVLHRENLVRSMFTGCKLGAPQDAIRSSWRSVAALLMAGWMAVLAWAWTTAPASEARPGAHGEHREHHHDDDD